MKSADFSLNRRFAANPGSFWLNGGNLRRTGLFELVVGCARLDVPRRGVDAKACGITSRAVDQPAVYSPAMDDSEDRDPFSVETSRLVEALARRVREGRVSIRSLE